MLNYSDLFNKSWNSIKDQLPLVAGLTLVYMVGLTALGTFHVFGALFTIPFGAGYLVCLLKVRNKETFSFQDILWGFQNFNRFLHLVLANFLVIFLLIAGSIFFVIPGIWFGVASSLTTAYLVLNDTDAVTALKSSLAAVKGHWWKMAGLISLIGLLFFAGAMCFLIGVLIAMPIAALLVIHAAEALASKAGASSTATSVLHVNPS